MAMTGDLQCGGQHLQGLVSATVHTTGNTTFGGVNTNQWWNGWQPSPADQRALHSHQIASVSQPQQNEKREPHPHKEQAPMRGLFEVFIVDPFGFVNSNGVTVSQVGDIAYECKVVADSDSSAKLKALLAFQSADDLAHYRGRDIDDVDIIVRRLGDVRPKRKVQEVKVVKE